MCYTERQDKGFLLPCLFSRAGQTGPIAHRIRRCSPMDNRELAALHSKLVIYRNGLQNAKARGDLDKARQWLEGIAALKKQIAHRDDVTVPPKS